MIENNKMVHLSNCLLSEIDSATIVLYFTTAAITDRARFYLFIFVCFQGCCLQLARDIELSCSLFIPGTASAPSGAAIKEENSHPSLRTDVMPSNEQAPSVFIAR